MCVCVYVCKYVCGTIDESSLWPSLKMKYPLERNDKRDGKLNRSFAYLLNFIHVYIITNTCTTRMKMLCDRNITEKISFLKTNNIIA